MRRFGLAAALGAVALGACATPELPARPPAGALGLGLPDPAGPRYRLAAVGPINEQATDASSQLSSNPATAATDGNNATAWSDGGYRNATSWLRLRYAADVSISAVSVRMPPSQTGTSYDLQVSGDGTTWTTALANVRNTTWNPETKTMPAGTHGRYLRLFWRNSTTAPVPHVNVYEITALGDGGTSTPAPSTAPSAAPSTAPSSAPTATPTAAPSSATGYPRAATPGPRTVTGFVYNNGRPIAGITIKVGSQTLTTDANGRYTATNLANGYYQAYYYNCCDRNKIGYWRSRAVAVDGTRGASVPTVDLYLVGMQNTPPMDARIRLPYTFVWKPPMQLPVGYYWRIHDRPYTSFKLVYQSAKLPGTATTYTFSGSGVYLDPNHRYFWGVQWDWGELGMGGNLYQAAYMSK